MKIAKVPLHFNRNEFLTPFDRMFDNLLSTQFPEFEKDFGISFEKGSFPKVDVADYDDSIVIIAEIPSLNKDALNIDIEDGILSISGDKHQLDDDNVRYIRKELKHSSFRRSFQLGDLLDTDNISANFEDGVLRIEIPKKEPTVPKKQKVDIK
jgi:HSP20 family protein|tara:strand:+ start:252 stop:710 length:459 start_codon:yes stop_codon:yes gene_type:complete